MAESIGALLAKRAHLGPDLEAFVEVERGRRFTYRDANSRANRLAGALADLGVRAGDRIAVLLHNGVEYADCYFGAAKLGAVLVPLNWRLSAGELEFILSDSGASAIVFASAFDDLIDALRARLGPLETWIRVGGGPSQTADIEDYDRLLGSHPDAEPSPGPGGADPLFIMYTSGTTGTPKGAVHTHDSMLWGSLTFNITCDARYRDRELIVLPLFHIGGLLPLTCVVHRGGTAVVVREFDLERIFQAIAAERVNTMMGVTSILQRMLEVAREGRFDCSSIRWLITGGEPVPPELITQYDAIGIQIHQDYGLTECGPATIISPEDAVRKAGSAGKPFVHTDVRVVDDELHDRPAGELGEVIVRGRHVMRGYWNQPDATAETLADGWLRTGDLATMDAEGFLYIQGRKKDMIISGGENIYPAEIERVLASHPGVREVAVIGQPSPKWGESPAAIVVPVPNSTLTASEVIEYCRGRIARYKVPKCVEFTDEIPRTPTGKPKKHLLRERFPGPAPE